MPSSGRLRQNRQMPRIVKACISAANGSHSFRSDWTARNALKTLSHAHSPPRLLGVPAEFHEHLKQGERMLDQEQCPRQFAAHGMGHIDTHYIVEMALPDSRRN
jgi:hypothetical protein